jgi:hypothetical protein
MKRNGFWLVMFVLTIVLVLSSCSNGDDNEQTFTVIIGTLTNANGCTITASPTSGKEGTEITLTVNEVNNYRLKAGTLKYGTTAINETTKKFNLPAGNVTVTAEFELNQTLSPYAGTWKSNQYQAQMIIEGSSTLTATLQLRENETSPWDNTAKGALVIDGTNATLTYTHVWKDGDWSDNAQDITEAASVIGSNPMTGTVNGSSVGSILFDHLVKQ